MTGERHVKRLLRVASVYEAFQALIGAGYARRWLREHFWKCRPGDRIVDIGCGPGDVLRSLPEGVHYWGFDPHAPYIAEARAAFGSRGVFHAGKARDFLASYPDLRGTVDLVISNGVLHHLPDAEAGDVLEVARLLMAPAGRFVALEPCFLLHQTFVSRWIMSRDRGDHVRPEWEWKRLLHGHFPSAETHIVTGLIRIPYTHIILVGRLSE
ncbi:MAG: class I SAM-dependent methyltransferase [Candidatus Sumerlaeaceae bacterium]|nr:class I SAM-dependent methyltransferase [Candidatus Sumerlaeaceae bacterium]